MGVTTSYGGAGESTRATVITDASFCPHTRAAGWAAWIVLNEPNGLVNRLKKSGWFKDLPKNSADAEKLACFCGIWHAYQNDARRILVQTDCMSVVVAGRTGGYRRIGQTYWPDAAITWRHVKGHTSGKDRRTWVNNWCDEEAKRYMREQRRDIQSGVPY